VEVEETEGEEMIPGGMSDLTIPEYDPHDPLCPSVDDTESEYCALCHCDLITKVRQDMLAKCIEVVANYAEERLVRTRHPNRSEDITAALRVATNRLRALQEKP